MSESDSVTATLYLRSSASAGVNGSQQETIDQVNHLVETGVLDRVDIEVWGATTRINPAIRTRGHEAYTALKEWAADTEYTLTPGFSQGITGTLVDEDKEDYKIIRHPLVCLVVYASEEVQAVFPCSSDDQSYTVADGLTSLESWAKTDRAFADEWP